VCVAQVALLFDDEAMWREAIAAPTACGGRWPRGITSDYLWWEQSLGYNNYVVWRCFPLFSTAGVYGHAAELDQEMGVAENLMLSLVYLRFPNGLVPNPADSSGCPRAEP